jgi:hypothetical protein
MSIETFAFSVTYASGFYEVFQPTNGNATFLFPQSQCVTKTHPTDGNIYYFGTNVNLIPLDYTLCTNLTVASRKAQIDAIVALATAAPLGAVTVTSGNVNVSSSLGEVYSASGTRSSSGNVLVLRPNATTAKILQISAVTSAALSAGTNMQILQGATVTGGTWAPVAGLTGSKMEQNTGGVVTLAVPQVTTLFGSQVALVISDHNCTYTTLQPIVVAVNFSGLGNSSTAVVWTEAP